MNNPLLPLFTRRTLLVFAALGALSTGRAQTAPLPLDPYITLGTRTPAPARTIGSAVDTISVGDLERRQVRSLADALASVAGIAIAPSGGPGSSASIFLRGANSNQTLFLVDGLRLNDPNTDYNLFLGGACIAACDSLEISHGPQSTLYGGEAVGGVVSLRAQAGAGEATGRIALEGGSFGTVQGALAAQGTKEKWAYNFAAQGGHTDNERENNTFDSANVTLRLDRAVSETVSLGATLRWFHGVYGSPGDIYTNDPDNEDREDNLLGTVFADFKHTPELTSHVILGGQDRRFVSENPGAFGTQTTVVKNRRGVLDWQSTFTGWEKNRITAGFNAEANHTLNTGFGEIDRKQSLLAFFVQDEFTPVENVFLTAGLRSDDFDTFGRATTGRVTGAWLVAERTVKLRASYGTAFRSPGFLDLYGRSAFYVGNPDLAPEKAKGWDAGVDYFLPENRGTLGATYFENRFRNLIVYDFNAFPGTTANVERARTRGVEFSALFKPVAALQTRVSYTYLEADNLTQGIRLLRRPRHTVSADIGYDFGGGFSAGAGVIAVLDRQDVNAATFATIDAADYSVVRLYGAWQINERFTVKARVENLLDKDYEPVNGFPALGLGGFAGFEWAF